MNTFVRIIKYQVIWLLLMLPLLNGYSQTSSQYFYYYQGKKVFLEPDKKTIAISWEGDLNTAKLSSFAAAKAPTRLSPIAEDPTRNTLVTIDQRATARKSQKTFYLEVSQSDSQTDYAKAVEAYRSLENVVMASPCFKSAKGQRMGLSNNLYVKLNKASDIDILYDEAARLNLEVLGHNEFMPLWFTLSCGKTTKINALNASNLLYETGLFESAEPAFMYHDLLSSADPYFPNQWGLKNTGQYGSAYAGIDIKAEQAWAITSGSPGIKVAVFDHGFEMNHPDLQANTYGTGYDAYTGTSPSVVRGNHGTACAGIVAAVQNNNLGVSGVAPTSKLISVSITLDNADTPQMLANGFNWAWQNGADVISNSWGNYAPSSIIEDAITETLTKGRGNKGTVVVFAAGNGNDITVGYPGNSNPLILVVGAVSPCGERKNPGSCDGEDWGSSYGYPLDVVAPGVKIPTTDRQGANGYNGTNYKLDFNGTSSACPGAAGVAALVLSANPSLTVQQVTDIIEESAQKVRTDLYNYAPSRSRKNRLWNIEMGHGLINAYEAVVLATSYCTVDQIVTNNVVAPNSDNRQASNSITATNIINNDATATYHAGAQVKLSPGFRAAAGSVFRAYIQGCTSTFSAQAKSSDALVQYDYRDDAPATAPESAADGSLQIIPNPLSRASEFQYTLASSQVVSLKVVDMMGQDVSVVIPREHKQAGTHTVTFESSNLRSGLYLVVLTTENGIIKKRAIKE